MTMINEISKMLKDDLMLKLEKYRLSGSKKILLDVNSDIRSMRLFRQKCVKLLMK